ncbi:MAG: DNA-directed RNA polymerase subunit beta, partial [Cyanobacteria bacterium J06554_11]
WALEAFGAAYTLQELLTVKSDDMQGRNEALNAIVKGKAIPRPGTPESFKVLMRELQSLCLDIAVHKLETQEDGTSRDSEVDLMADVGNRRTPSRPTYESISRDEPAPATASIVGNAGTMGLTGNAIAPPGSAVVSSPAEDVETQPL